MIESEREELEEEKEWKRVKVKFFVMVGAFSVGFLIGMVAEWIFHSTKFYW